MSFSEKIESRNRYAFTISYQGTDENAATHNRFKKFAEKHDNVYISALRSLLDEHEERLIVEELHKRMNDIEEGVLLRIAQLEEMIAELQDRGTVTEKKPTLKTFGKEE